MSLPPIVRSATLPLQVLISGRVQDSLTPGEAPRSSLTVRLLEIEPSISESEDYPYGYNYEEARAIGGELLDPEIETTDRMVKGGFPLRVNVRPDGTFAIFGVPETAFPGIAEKTYHLRLEASAPNYEPATFDFDVGPITGQPELVARSIPLPEVPDTTVKLFTRDLPRSNISLFLRRSAVRLRGRVIELNNLSQGIENATVSVANGPSATTGSDGKFEFSTPMPVKASIAITVSATYFDNKTFEYELNYNQTINSLLISLTRTS
ncbi:MAG: hypothetical protein QNJ65_00965 [Xenococcaceae cyanobacterium MO_234.B1]|nr:hypothetical protein [Xenococcaceae cyanobacterium MO_234.B1]